MAEAPRTLILAGKAERDLIDIWKYVAKASAPDTADNVLRDIKQAVQRLADRPFTGRPRNVYRVTDSTVDISRILHERRDFDAAFAKHSPP
jgi:plasmid stabilization system protein ParE